MAEVTTDMDADELDPAYRSVSTVAVVGLLLGLASPLALVSPLLVALPCFALLTVWVALRQIAASDGALVGRAPALVGLALAVVSLSAVVTRDVVSRHRLNDQAAEAVDRWLDTVRQGDLREAYLLTLPPRERSGASTRLDEEGGEYASAFASFQQLPALAPLLASSGAEGLELRKGGRPLDAGAGRLIITQEYDISLEGRDEPARFSLILERSAPSARAPAEWRVAQIERAPESG